MEMITIYVGHIRPEVNVETIIELFRPYGEVYNPRIIPNKLAPPNPHPNGPIYYNCAFLEMEKTKGERAIDHFERWGVAFRRKRLHIHKATGEARRHLEWKDNSWMRRRENEDNV